MRTWAIACLLPLAALSARAATPIAGQTAPRWTPQPKWVGRVPNVSSVRERDGRLVFRVEGVGCELPWTLGLRDSEQDGDAGYLLVRYRAVGVDNRPGNYFLHGYDGVIGGRTYAFSNEIVADGAWHTLAVDLVAGQSQEPANQLALKVVCGPSGWAEVTVDRIWFADAVPGGATVAKVSTPPPASYVLPWSSLAGLRLTPEWTTSPASEASAVDDGENKRFAVGGAGRQMRWTCSLPKPIDLATMRGVSFRYRAAGGVGRTAYVFWLGGAGGKAFAPAFGENLRVDGLWHTYTAQAPDGVLATDFAVGLDSEDAHAEVTLGPLHFYSGTPVWRVDEVLPYQAVSTTPPGFSPARSAVTGGRRSGQFVRRLGLADWFSASSIVVGGVPFEVPPRPDELRSTGFAEHGAVRAALPPGAREVYLLTAVACPASEPFGLDASHPRPIERLSEPEQAVAEIVYASGPSDFVLPADAATGRVGLVPGLAVHVLRPDPARRATAVVLHDRMQTASLAILGVTVSRTTHAHPATAAPPHYVVTGLHRGAGAPELAATFASGGALTWRSLAVKGRPGPLACDPGPVFEVEIGGKVLPNAEWTVEGHEGEIAMVRWTLRHRGTGLVALVEAVQAPAGEVLLRMSLRNEGPSAVKATLRFPVLRAVRVGSAADTWYLFERRGGIVNRADGHWREALGEPHPLQVDGFFGPKTGLALACMTHDTRALHHFIRLAKSSAGGDWSIEYPLRDIAPGTTFEASEASLQVRAGDWQAIFSAYKEWLATWYRPPARKPWWEKVFAYVTLMAHYDLSPDPLVRGAIAPAVRRAEQYLGACDYAHLFGWASSQKWGDWGDYDHYDETVGGLEYFRGNIARSQASGVPVGLYIDGYLNGDKGQASGARAREWAMARADGSANYVPEYGAFNECPFVEPWRDYLSSVYRRVQRDLKPMGLYVDEYGATDARWLCQSTAHGHNGYEVPYAGEVAMLRSIREAVGTATALYSEYPPAEVSRQMLDGSFTYQALWSIDQRDLAPHLVDLPRFAFPRFKQFHIIHYVPLRAGNWWIYKAPFFNGEGYNIGEPNLSSYDAASIAFLRRAIAIQRAHCDAFSSDQVEPLVDTLVPGVYANAFHGARETVWTLFNANPRSVHAAVLRVPHIAGAVYRDAWTGAKLAPVLRGRDAYVAVELGPKGLGCVVQRR